MSPLYSYAITFEQFRNTQTDLNGILTADKIGPSIAQDMTWNAIYSVLFSLIAIGLYITFRFKRWQWATGATAALAFNALLIIGIFSMFYGLLPFNLEVNQAFIAAILTIIGYAINDTVVVFDRIREYLGLYPKRNLKASLVNGAINSTLSRTINTSGHDARDAAGDLLLRRRDDPRLHLRAHHRRRGRYGRHDLHRHADRLRSDDPARREGRRGEIIPAYI